MRESDLLPLLTLPDTSCALMNRRKRKSDADGENTKCGDFTLVKINLKYVLIILITKYKVYQ